MGVDELWWHPLPPAPNGFVLTVGRDLARDYETFLDAVRDLPRRVVVVAKSENLEGLTIPRNVQIRMDVPSAALRELYAGAACVVVPIRPPEELLGTENSGNTALLEAMACARPIVVSRRVYFDDYVRDGDSVLTVPPRDPSALRAAIERLLTDRELADQLGARAREVVEERLTTRHYAAHVAGVLATMTPA